MRIPTTITAVTGIALMTASALAIPASATGPARIGISPAEVEAGGAVSVSVYCVGDTAPAGAVTSPAFAKPIALKKAASGWGYTGAGKAGSKPGTYTIEAPCGNKATTTFTVTAAPPNTTKPKQPPTSTTTPKQVPRVPSGGVETGGGGAAYAASSR